MEEDIKIIEEKIRYLNQHLNSYEKKDCKTAVYQELKKEKEALESVLNRLQENEAVIKEMSKSIVNNNDIEYEVCENVHELSIECDGYSRETKEHCEKCIENYFRKKVQDERNKV